ncbi:MAG TPA: hypothetical protein VGH91_04475 [Gammaproteobacteria bacterium]|jgi:hypothetical protein
MADDNQPQVSAKTAKKPLLTVREPFDDYQKGDQIFDADEAKTVQESHPHFVTRLP